MASPSLTIKVFSLDCFDVKVVSSDRERRTDALADYVIQRNYDIVFLQEMYVKDDYKWLSEALHPVLPYSVRYASSSFVGSLGLAIFSRWPFANTHSQQFRLQGNCFMMHHGDGFAFKGIAYAKIKLKYFTLHLFNACLHSKFNKVETELNQYSVHRLGQVYEITKYIETVYHKSEKDILLLAGDFNFTQKDLHYNLLCTKLNIFDCHTCNKYFQCDGIQCRTVNHPVNTIHEVSVTCTSCDQLNKTDYIFFDIKNRSCLIEALEELGLDEHNHSISDHQPLGIKLTIQPSLGKILNLSTENSLDDMNLSNIYKTYLDATKRIFCDYLLSNKYQLLISVAIVYSFLLAIFVLSLETFGIAILLLLILYYFTFFIIRKYDEEYKSINYLLDDMSIILNRFPTKN